MRRHSDAQQSIEFKEVAEKQTNEFLTQFICSIGAAARDFCFLNNYNLICSFDATNERTIARRLRRFHMFHAFYYLEINMDPHVIAICLFRPKAELYGLSVHSHGFA